MLESTYEECLAYELDHAGFTFQRQVPQSIYYKDIALDAGYRLDIVIEGKLILELKSVSSILPIHEAQLLTYMKLSGISTGLLLNFNVAVLREGIKRLVL